MQLEPAPLVFDSVKIRAMFPILSRELRPGVPLVYLDSAATSQKPKQVIDASAEYYTRHNANIHRGIYRLAEEATEAYEHARAKVSAFIGARSTREVIFTRNTTESINLIANSWGRANLNAGDLILLTEMEHHSNIVPWQMLAAALDLQIAYVPITEDGLLDLEVYRDLLQRKPRLVGFVHMSNVLGTINPAAELTSMAHDAGALVVVDGAQAVPHLPVDVVELGADFYAFSGHKMCGPTGVGVLFGREELLKAMPPFMGGGDMIKQVTLEGFTSNELPWKFEAGTPGIAQGIGLGAAVDFLSSVGMETIQRHEQMLVEHAIDRLVEVPGVKVLGPEAEKRGGVASFSMEGIHPHDIAQILDSAGIAVRAGHHCAMPIHKRYSLPASTRASFYLYNTIDEIDALIEGLYKVKEIFG